MIKKLLFLLLIIASFGHAGVKGQSCTPDNQYTLPGIYPDTLVGLPCAHTTVLYQTTITIITPTDSLYDLGAPLGTINAIIDSIVVQDNSAIPDGIAVNGLPPGFTYVCNPPSCSWPGGSTGSICLIGTPGAGDTGTYNVTIEMDAYVNQLAGFGNPPVNMDDVDQYSIVVSSVAPPVPVITTTNDSQGPPSCDGTGTISGGVTYQWDNNAGGVTTPTAAGLCAGTYNVAAIDVNGCAGVGSATINIGSLGLQLSYTNVTCYGGADATASVQPLIGTPPFSYLWSTGAITSSISGLIPGNHDVTITDALGVVDYAGFTVAQPPELLVSLTSTNPSNCASCDGIATITASGGSGPLSYLWNDNNSQTSSTANSLCQGIFIATVTDTNNCSAMDTVTLFVSATANLSFTVNSQLFTAPPFAVQFDNTTPNPSNYNFTWDFGDGNVSATNNLTVFHEYLYNGTYDITLIAEDTFTGCIDTLLMEDHIFCTGGTIGIDDLKENNIHIYPNPTTGILTIEGVKGIATVYDIYGRLVLTTKTNTLDISNAARGIYFVRVMDEQGRLYSQKVVKD